MIISKPASQAYVDNWEAIFGKKEERAAPKPAEVEVWVDGNWHAVDMMDLKDGDKFRMFNTRNGVRERVIQAETPYDEWFVVGPPFLDQGVACVETTPEPDE